VEGKGWEQLPPNPSHTFMAISIQKDKARGNSIMVHVKVSSVHKIHSIKKKDHKNMN
jgi:hypothetical protein